MDADDEQLLRGRVYGCDPDDPHPGPLPHQTYAALVGGPLDGLLLDITGWRPEEVDDGAALMTELGRWPGGRALYDPRPRRPAPIRRPGRGVPLLLLQRHTLTPAASPGARHSVSGIGVSSMALPRVAAGQWRVDWNKNSNK
ncbi:hypothetical protein [Streptomyces sp. KHY 26]|uniref:hypothetical protein n=1 Tax=Streptomyces sp. KHY 26 TaxID=3097359 RepID=UPI00376EF2B4